MGAGAVSFNKYNRSYSDLQKMDKNKDKEIHPKEYDEFYNIQDDSQGGINEDLFAKEITAQKLYQMFQTFDINNNKKIDADEGEKLDMLLNGNYKALIEHTRTELVNAKTNEEKIKFINAMIYIYRYFGYLDKENHMVNELAKYCPSDEQVVTKRLIPLLAGNDFKKIEAELKPIKGKLSDHLLNYIKVKELLNAKPKERQILSNEFTYTLCSMFKTKYGEFKNDTLKHINSFKEYEQTHNVYNEYTPKIFALALKHKEYDILPHLGMITENYENNENILYCRSFFPFYHFSNVIRIFNVYFSGYSSKLF